MRNEDAAHRRDIDGLRGVAIGAVVVFHLFPAQLRGGFTGVDVFFVISGYLITGQILERQRAGAFTFADFYARRIRRLMPALLVVLAACLLAGYQLLLGAEFRTLAKHVLGGATYSSNFLLLHEGGYFDTPAQTKPLQHLWSLGIEEQYYALWPLLLWLSRHWAPRWKAGGLAALVLASFAANVALTLSSPMAAFYLPVGRLWELGLGGIAAAVPGPTKPAVRAGLGAGGLALVVAGIAVCDEAGFPGFLSLLPTVGTLMLVLAGPDGAVNRSLLGRGPLPALGLVSYALYLWHWPAIVFTRLVELPQLTPGAQKDLSLLQGLVVVGVSLAAAFASTRWLEQPVRARRLGSVRSLLVLHGALAALAVACFTGLLPPRNATASTAALEAASRDYAQPSGVLEAFRADGQRFLRTPGAPAVVFVGDSNMEMYVPALEERVRRGPTRPFAVLAHHGCPPFGVVEPGPGDCAEYLAAVQRFLQDPAIDTVVVAAQWSYYFDSPHRTRDGVRLEAGDARTARVFEAFGAWLREVGRGRRVFVVLGAPSSPSVDPLLLLRRSWLGGVAVEGGPLSRTELAARAEPVRQLVRSAALAADARLIDPFDAFCGPTTCDRLEATGAPLYIDAYHVRPGPVRERFHAFDALLDPRAPPDTPATPGPD